MVLVLLFLVRDALLDFILDLSQLLFRLFILILQNQQAFSFMLECFGVVVSFTLQTIRLRFVQGILLLLYFVHLWLLAV